MRSIIVLFLLSGITLAVLHSAGIYLYLYWYYTWFDIPVHMLGGFLVVIGMGVVASIGWIDRSLATKKTVIGVSLLAVMIAWELFEFYFGISDATDPIFLPDTTLDFIMGSVGGVLGYVVLRKTFLTSTIK